MQLPERLSDGALPGYAWPGRQLSPHPFRRTITTRYLPQTTFRPSRIRASDGDNSVTVSYHADSPAIPPAAKYQVLPEWLGTPERLAAIKLCQVLKWTGKLIEGNCKDGSSVFVFLHHDGLLATRGRLSADCIDLDAIKEAGIEI